MITVTFDAGELTDGWAATLDRLSGEDVIRRLWDLDHTVVSDDPSEVADRMGWIHLPSRSLKDWPAWVLAADEAVEGPAGSIEARVDHVLILGMGGSSLFPEVLASTFDAGPGFPTIVVLDSTDPVAVARVDEQCPPDRTLVVAASKSGTTIETRSHLAYFWQRHPIGRDFAVVTDPGSALEKLANTDEFRYVAHGVPEIGGRFSALSAFGMFPAALMGLDGIDLLHTAAEVHDLLGPDTPVDENIAVQLGALLGTAALAGRDKLTFVIEDSLSEFGSWLEQLIAESTGKNGKGILPIVGEDMSSPDSDTRIYAVIGSPEFIASLRKKQDRMPGPSVELVVEEPQDLGAQVFLWELATAVAGIVLGINPFDQPNVEAAKQAARDRLISPGETVELRSVDDALDMVRPGDALVLGAFVDPALEPQLQAARQVLSARAAVPTTLGIGPRFLHSTGQLHKGGPDRLVMVQVLSDTEQDLPIPGEDFGFGQLKHAQADGDLAAMEAAGKRAVRVPLEELLGLA